MPFGIKKQMEQNRQKIDRTSAWILLGIGVFVFIGGAFQMRSHLFAFDRSLEAKFQQALEERGYSTADAAQDRLANSDEGNDLANLQNTDSDQDGLTDFEELYVRGTSPYLQDTDSDGITDYTEIAENTNPNCPEGQQCVQERVGGDTIVTDAEESLRDLAGNTTNDSVVLDPVPELSSEEIKAFLVQSGVPQSDVDQIADEDLQDIYRQVYEREQSGASANSQVQSEIERLQNMTTEERREYLVSSGVAASEVDALSDDEINVLFEQGLADTIAELGVPTQTDTTTNTEE